VITCFPETPRVESEREPSTDSKATNKEERDEGLVNKIRRHIHEDARPQISSVYHLATIIASLCAAEVENYFVDKQGSESFLHMFASSIATVVSIV
jgi:hypothetical protein